jgi:GntR family transcriptional regulator
MERTKARRASEPVESLVYKIDRHNPMPLYVQLKEALIEYIEKKKLRPGDQIPGEMDLCQMYDVSRTVVRQALQEFAYEGLITKSKGRGAFIAAPKISESLVQKLTGFHQDMAARGYRPVSKVLEQKVVSASAKIAEKLRIGPGSAVIKITRLRFIDDEPLILATTYLPHDRCPGVEKEDFRTQSLYELMERRYGLVITHGHRLIGAVAANEYEAGLLKIAKGAPLIQLDSVSFLGDGTPIEYYRALHRGDREQFSVELVRIQKQGTVKTPLSGVVLTFPPDEDGNRAKR